VGWCVSGWYGGYCFVRSLSERQQVSECRDKVRVALLAEVMNELILKSHAIV
jgi:hypothetical protein